MPAFIQSRVNHIHTLWREGLWGRWIAAVYFCISIFEFVRDEVWQPSNESKWRIINMIPHLTLSWWLFFLVAILLAWTFEASFRSAEKLRGHISEFERDAASPLEIIFDPNNPARRFWSMESPQDENGLPKPGVFWEHRVEVKNNSLRTLRNVSITTEHLGQLPVRPIDQIFDKIKKTSCDLKPGCSELVPVVRWPIPKIQAGMLADLSALEYGPIKIIASADDSAPSVRTFKFDYQTEQMLFD